jgi:hypothetical protein
MGSSDLAIPDFWSLTCGSCIWWDPHVSDSKSGKVRNGKLEDPAPLTTRLLLLFSSWLSVMIDMVIYLDEIVRKV